MSEIEDRLGRLAEQLRVEVVETVELTARMNACYVAASGVIYVRKNLDPVTRACAIAHELGHAFYGHECSTPRFERVADIWAARQLLDGRVTLDLLREYRDAPGALAAELGVTPRLLSLWLDCDEHHKIK